MAKEGARVAWHPPAMGTAGQGLLGRGQGGCQRAASTSLAHFPLTQVLSLPSPPAPCGAAFGAQPLGTTALVVPVVPVAVVLLVVLVVPVVPTVEPWPHGGYLNKTE